MSELFLLYALVMSVIAGGLTALAPALKARKQTKNLHLMVTRKAEKVFGDAAAAADWLNSKNTALGGVTPRSLLNTGGGTQSVLDVLGRIEHGVFS